MGESGAMVLKGLAALAALAMLIFPPARLGGLIGSAIGALLRWLGFFLALTAGAAVATAGGSEEGSEEGDEGQPEPVKIPGGRSADMPPGTVTVPSGPAVPPAAIGVEPEAGTIAGAPSVGPTRPSVVSPPARTPKPAKPAGTRRAAKKAPAPIETIKVSVIEGMNLKQVQIGTISFVLLDPKGSNKRALALQAIKKETKGEETTVVFLSVLEACESHHCNVGRRYIVTHPKRASDAPELVGVNVAAMNRFNPLAWNTDALADMLDKAGRKAEADQVRKIGMERERAITQKAGP